MYHYDPLVLGFILSVELPFLRPVKSKLVEVVRRIESDDRGYIYHPNNLEILQHSGPVVASIANYEPPENFNLEIAIKQTILSMSTQDVDSKKYVFIIVDQFEQEQVYGIKQALNLDVKIDCNCAFTFFGLGSRYDPVIHEVEKWHPRCQFIALSSPEFLTEKIISIAKVRDIKLLWEKHGNNSEKPNESRSSNISNY